MITCSGSQPGVVVSTAAWSAARSVLLALHLRSVPPAGYGPMELSPYPMTARRTKTSWSEIDAWSTCRQRWHWAYGRNLEPRHSSQTPTFGSCGHEALAAHMRGEDWSAAIDKWLANELATRHLLEGEDLDYIGIAETIRQIIPRYIAYYPNDVQAVEVEYKFIVPIAKTSWTLEGYFDAIVKDSLNRYWIKETKFPRDSFRTEEMVELDGQLGVYHHAAIRSGFPVVGIIYDQVLAKVPTIPKLTQKGEMSRADIRCDWPTYVEHLLANGLNPEDYPEMAIKLADKPFFKRYYIYRPQIEIKNFVDDMNRRIWDMSRTRAHIYMSENRINCTPCPFRELCIGKLKGADLEGIIERQYAPRRSRRDDDALINPDEIVLDMRGPK